MTGAAQPRAVWYRLMQSGDETAVSELAVRVFNEFVAPDFSDAGVREFHRYAAPNELAERARADHFVLLAAEPTGLVGMIEIRGFTHVAMLFVAQQGRGIGRELLRRSLLICRQHRPDVSRITVHSGPSAVAFYRVLGFRLEGPEREQTGIRFVPMVLELGGARQQRSPREGVAGAARPRPEEVG